MAAPGGPAEPPPSLVTEPFLKGLAVAVVVDTPRNMRYLDTRQLGALKISASQALSIAKRNTARQLGEVTKELFPVPGTPLLSAREDPYSSSRVLAHGAWAAVAAKLQGDLLVAIPCPDIIMAADAGVPGASAFIERMAATIYDDQARPLLRGLLRWTPKGWVPAR